MFTALVILQVKDFNLFDEYERAATAIMSDHGGKITAAFETVKNDDNSGEEVHMVEFPGLQDFESYRNDSRLQDLRNTREKAISSTEIGIGVCNKKYS